MSEKENFYYIDNNDDTNSSNNNDYKETFIFSIEEQEEIGASMLMFETGVPERTYLAAQNGNVLAQYKVGDYYFFGYNHTEINLQEAKYWYTLSAAQGHKEAKEQLIEVEKIENYIIGAQNGDTKCEYSLAFLYREGKGVEKNKDKAIELFQSAANKNHLESIYQLGHCYNEYMYDKCDFEKSLQYFVLAADKGHISAAYYAGYAYYYGIKADKTPDIPKAIKYLTIAANGGLSMASRLLEKIEQDKE